MSSSQEAFTPVIIVHGGAWAIPDELLERSKTGVRESARLGYEVLERGGSALDAVEAAIRSLEDDDAFDAGRGAELNELGEVELDAVIMDGTTLGAGAVAGVHNISNPISLARRVMTDTPHVLLVGHGADRFAKDCNIARVSAESLTTESARKRWEQFGQKFPGAVRQYFNAACEFASPHVETVGAVAFDRNGNLAAGTSTGGICGKMVGRVGDSPIVGSGCYADNRSGAVSSTGHGESIIKVTLARHATFLMESGVSASVACAKALDNMLERTGGRGGLIAVDRRGELGFAFTAPRMAYAYKKAHEELVCACPDFK